MLDLDIGRADLSVLVLMIMDKDQLLAFLHSLWPGWHLPILPASLPSNGFAIFNVKEIMSFSKDNTPFHIHLLLSSTTSCFR